MQPDWVWRKYIKEYTPASEFDYKERDLIEHDMLKSYIKEIKKLPYWPSKSDANFINTVKSLWGLSDHDWNWLTNEEKEYYMRETKTGGLNA